MLCVARRLTMRMMNVAVVALAGLLAGVAGVCADPIDDAAAKQRGVSVEVIQLENARTKIAEMEKRITTLQKENATLKEALMKAQNTPATAPATAPAKVTVAPDPSTVGLPVRDVDPSRPRGRTVRPAGR
jgi:hypothetical protein